MIADVAGPGPSRRPSLIHPNSVVTVTVVLHHGGMTTDRGRAPTPARLLGTP
jgi:hypothetical protein